MCNVYVGVLLCCALDLSVFSSLPLLLLFLLVSPDEVQLRSGVQGRVCLLGRNVSASRTHCQRSAILRQPVTHKRAAALESSYLSLPMFFSFLFML